MQCPELWWLHPAGQSPNLSWEWLEVISHIWSGDLKASCTRLFSCINRGMSLGAELIARCAPVGVVPHLALGLFQST